MSLPKSEFKTVAELLADEKRWTQKSEARDHRGYSCSPQSRRAVRFCAVGAIERIYGDNWADAYAKLLRKLPPRSIGPRNFNDTHTHAEVLEKVREAKI